MKKSSKKEDNDDDHNQGNNSDMESYYGRLQRDSSLPGNWTENPNVYCKYNELNGGILHIGKKGYNCRSNQQSRQLKFFGPEVGFGSAMTTSLASSSATTKAPKVLTNAMIADIVNNHNYNTNEDNDKNESEFTIENEEGQQLEQPIVILKQAWGGKSLAIDFRPPSSGRGKYKRLEKDSKQRNNFRKNRSIYYDAMIKNIHHSMRSLRNNSTGGVPQNDKACGSLQSALQTTTADTDDDDSIVNSTARKNADIVVYDSVELAGFVWFQGWNDLTDDRAVEYEYNLQNFIHDVRHDLEVPNLPFVS